MITRIKCPFFVFFAFFLFNSLNGQESQLKIKDLNEAAEINIPNPIHLQPEWLTYFDVDYKTLEKRIQSTQSLLNTIQKQLETTEEKQEAETRIKEFQSRLESLLLIKEQVVKQPLLTWLPKSSYSLKDYLNVSDQIRDLNLDIGFKNVDRQRFEYSASDVRQSVNNDYAKYLTLKEYSLEKFFKGLEVMSLGARLLYLEGEIKWADHLIKVDKQLLERYQSERDLIDKRLNLKVNLKKLIEKRVELTRDLSVIHSELLGLEAQSIKTFAKQHGQEASRLVNQKLMNSLIKEMLVKAKLFLIEAEFILNKALYNPDEVTYVKDVDPIVIFRKNAYDQLLSWQQIASTNIDQLSQTLIKVNGESVIEGKTSSYEDSLKLSLSNRAFLEALSKELYHIEVVLGLINQHLTVRQTVLDQIFYHLQNFWYSFTQSFGGWFFYSLFDINGIPITLAGLFKAVLIILVAIWLSNLTGRALKKLARGKGRVLEPTLYTFRRIIHYLILIVGIFFALASLGLTMQNMIIVLGALGIGIGFGLQNIVNNFLCGLAILFERNIKIGDYVELESGQLGKITEVNIQNTTLHTFDGLDILVPNSLLVGNKVVNWTKNDSHFRVHIPFSVAYGSDQKKVSEVVSKAALNVSYTTGKAHGLPEPEVWLVELGESSLNFELIVWVDFYRGRTAIKSAYLPVIESALRENDIQIPFPQRDLHIKTIPLREKNQIIKKLI